MDYESCRSLPAMFFEQAGRLGDKPFLWAKRDGRYRATSWAEAAREVRLLARGLAALGIGRGDRVALVAENRPEWVIADFAIMSAGAITVPAYVTNTVDDHRHVFATSGARRGDRLEAALVGAGAGGGEPGRNPAHRDRDRARRGAGECRRPRVVDRCPGPGRRDAPDDIAERVAELAPDDIACLIFTSGTGGTPKGVMTTHRNILANCRGAFRLLEILGLGDEVFLSFLPLSHSYEHTAGMMFPVSIGAQIYFAEGADTLAANLLEARPTIMTAVPRLYETMHRRITLGVERKGAMARRMFDKAVAIGRKRAAFAEPQCRRAPAGAAARPLGARRSAPPLWRAAQGDGVGRGGAEPGDRQLLPGARASGCCRATARPRRRRSSPATCRRGSRSTRSGRRSTGSRCASPRTARFWSPATMS